MDSSKASHDFYAIDDASAFTAIDILLEDIYDAFNLAMGKSREGRIIDAESTLTTYEAELERIYATISDLQMSRALVLAIQR